MLTKWGLGQTTGIQAADDEVNCSIFGTSHYSLYEHTGLKM